MKRARKSGKELDWSTYRRLRNVVTRLIRNSKSNYTRNLFRENLNTPNKFWKHIKKCFPTKEVKGSNFKVFNIDGNVTSDTKKIANGFSTFFAKIGKNLQHKLISLSNSTWKHHDHSFWEYSLNPRNSIFKFQKTNISQIKNIIKAFGRSKAQGYDEIPMSLLIVGVDIIAEPLSVLIYRCLDNSLFPAAEKRAMG